MPIIVVILLIIFAFFYWGGDDNKTTPPPVAKKEVVKPNQKRVEPKVVKTTTKKEVVKPKVVEKPKPKKVVVKPTTIKGIYKYSGGKAGDKTGNLSSARYSYPTSLYSSGKSLYIIDEGNKNIKVVFKNKVSKIVPYEKRKFSKKVKHLKIQKLSSIVTYQDKIYVINYWKNSVYILAQDGLFKGKIKGKYENKFNRPESIVVKDGKLYLSDTNNNKILSIVDKKHISTFTGDSKGSKDGSLSSATFYKPSKLVYDNKNTLYVVDGFYSRIRVIKNGKVTTLKIPELKNQSINTIAYGANRLFIYSKSKGRLYIYNTKKNKIVSLKDNISKKIGTIADMAYYNNALIVTNSDTNRLYKIVFNFSN